MLGPGSLRVDSVKVDEEELKLEKGGVRPVSVSLDVSEAGLEEPSDLELVACRFRAVAGEPERSRLLMMLV